MIAIAVQQIETVIARLMKDQAFRARYCQDPDGTLAAYLTPDEIHAIKSGDGRLLGQLGQSPRWQELSAALCGPDPGP